MCDVIDLLTLKKAEVEHPKKMKAREDSAKNNELGRYFAN